MKQVMITAAFAFVLLGCSNGNNGDSTLSDSTTRINSNTQPNPDTNNMNNGSTNDPSKNPADSSYGAHMNNTSGSDTSHRQ